MGQLQERFESYREPQKFMAADVYPYFRAIEGKQGTEVEMGGHKVLMFGSNAYTGLTGDQRIIDAAKAALDKYGSGCAGSRFLNGTLDLHVQLEKEISQFIGKDDCLCFSTGFSVNQGVIPALLSKDDYVICDDRDHASIVDGRRLAFAKQLHYKHNDMDDLERVLQKLPHEAIKLIVIDGVFSMEGKERIGAILVLNLGVQRAQERIAGHHDRVDIGLHTIDHRSLDTGILIEGGQLVTQEVVTQGVDIIGHAQVLIQIGIVLCSTVNEVHDAVVTGLIGQADSHSIISVTAVSSKRERLLVQRMNTFVEIARSVMAVFCHMTLDKLLKQVISRQAVISGHVKRPVDGCPHSVGACVEQFLLASNPALSTKAAKSVNCGFCEIFSHSVWLPSGSASLGTSL